MSAIHWQAVVDFFVLVTGIYLLLRWSREARALRFALAVLGLRVGALLARQLNLLITSWVLEASTIIGLLALIVVFQPELRRALMQLDVTRRRRPPGLLPPLTAVSQAAWSLAQARCGAVIVVTRKDSLRELISEGVALEGRVSVPIAEAVFQKSSPVHDGAAVIEGPLITRVGCVLPLTQRSNVPGQWGTRHRAGMGLADRSDALVVVVSEERGEVTLMWEGRAQRMKNEGELEHELQALTTIASSVPAPNRRFRLPEPGLRAAAVGLAALVWSVTFLFPGRSVRVQTVPLEFTNVPSGMTIAGQSVGTVELWLRGTDFLFESVNLEALVARCDLRSAHQGQNAIQLQADAFDVPFGFRIESIAPTEVSVRLAKDQ
jgi:uncharacterized protein (TIGR00159 family)